MFVNLLKIFFKGKKFRNSGKQKKNSGIPAENGNSGISKNNLQEIEIFWGKINKIPEFRKGKNNSGIPQEEKISEESGKEEKFRKRKKNFGIPEENGNSGNSEEKKNSGIPGKKGKFRGRRRIRRERKFRNSGRDFFFFVCHTIRCSGWNRRGRRF